MLFSFIKHKSITEATATLSASRRDLNLKPKFDFDRANYKKSFNRGCGVEGEGGRGVLNYQQAAQRRRTFCINLERAAANMQHGNR